MSPKSEPVGGEWAWLPKFCLRTFGLLSEGSLAGFLRCKPFHRTLLKNPKCSEEFWGGGGSPGPSSGDSSYQRSGKIKAHKRKLFCPVGRPKTPGLSRGFHRVCPWDKPGFSPYFTQWKPDFTRFVPGTIPGTKGGAESLCEKT